MTTAVTWLRAARPATLTVGVAPVLVGIACARALGTVHVGPALAALIGAVLLQIGSNLTNDLYDFLKGADTDERLGPMRALQAGLLSARQVRSGMFVVFGAALATGIYLTMVAGPTVVVIGVASIAAALAYTAGPYPLGYHGLGDLFVFIFFGLVAVCGTVFVQLGRVPVLAFWAAGPVGALATAVLVVNNLRDRETDARAGKRTLAVRLGRRATLVQYGLLLLVAEAIPVGLSFAFGRPLLLLPLLTLPLAAQLVRAVANSAGRALNPLLGRTALLTFTHSLLFAVGLAL